MTESSPFIIYNASAGSGKTFTLVKQYLKILLGSDTNQTFRSILALTFTNKAVAEMKTRIINTLKEFATTNTAENSSAMFDQIKNELQFNSEQLQARSNKILKAILHNYGAFDISTIDRFNHRLIRTFAHDLKLPLNFEVELDTDYQLTKAVDRLIERAGTNAELTKLLVDFAIEKVDDDRSWDITYDFNNIASLLTKEHDLRHIEQLKEKSIGDFKNLQQDLFKKFNSNKGSIVNLARSIIELISNNGLDESDFSGKYLYKHFIKLAQGDFNVNLNLKWQTDLVEGKALYPKRVTKNKASTIDSIHGKLIDAFKTTKKFISENKFYYNALKNIIPLSVLNEINKSLNELKQEDDFILISEFNSIINSEIKQQPAPFIYERLGEKYRNYFIDEFQDTSILQWENLIPLIDNAISSQNLKGEIGMAILVGDAKQSIYRWRGGEAEQFIGLYQENKTPLALSQKVYNLPKNFRSAETIVDFNNNFFKHLSSFAFSLDVHQKTYAVEEQIKDKSLKGYVDITFLDSSEDTENDIQYSQQVLKTINHALSSGFSKSDICIIVRKSKEGIVLADYLIEHGIPIVSSETLLLKNAPEVVFINNLMRLAIEPDHLQIKLDLLDFIANDLLKIKDKHAFFQKNLHLDVPELDQQFRTYGFNFDFQRYTTLPIYEATEFAIRSFGLNKFSNAYLQFYLDEILAFSTNNYSNFAEFQKYWERKNDKLSIASPEGQDAIEIMTIHKSKGLEFPVVIFPYANQNVYFDMDPKVWFPFSNEETVGFSELYLSLNKDLAEYNNIGRVLYDLHQAELELDSINLLYVALTRAAEQLYVISEYDFSKGKDENLKLYSGLFINYLKSLDLWQSDQSTYQFGSCKKETSKELTETSAIELKLISTSKESHRLNIVTNNGLLWNTAQEAAIEKGNLVHEILATIISSNDIDPTLLQFKSQGLINDSQLSPLRDIVNATISHPQLKNYYESGLRVLNEKAIITQDGSILRPDRIVFVEQNVLILIDYKTGLTNHKHMEQLYRYQEELENMGFRVSKKILIYIDAKITVKEF